MTVQKNNAHSSGIKVLVITGYGINCEEETAAAFRMQGALADIVHINRLLNSEVSIAGYSIIAFPGGFSFGDDIFSGKVFANKIAYRKTASGTTLLEMLKEFLNAGNFIIGICNGFQVLCRLGLLPNTGGEYKQEMTLARNDGGSFINKWVGTKVTNRMHSVFSNLEIQDLPIRHGEGKVIFRDDAVRKAVLDRQLNWLTYTNNPNGSELDCAGVCDTTGRVIGLMPHPEAFLSAYNHPAWNIRKGRQQFEDAVGGGAALFKELVELARKKLVNTD